MAVFSHGFALSDKGRRNWESGEDSVPASWCVEENPKTCCAHCIKMRAYQSEIFVKPHLFLNKGNLLSPLKNILLIFDVRYSHIFVKKKLKSHLLIDGNIESPKQKVTCLVGDIQCISRSYSKSQVYDFLFQAFLPA